DWPTMPARSAAAWSGALAALGASHRRLLAAVRGLGEADLEGPVPGRDYSRYVLVHGVLQHTLYHAGQIALLKRAAAAGCGWSPGTSWPAADRGAPRWSRRSAATTPTSWCCRRPWPAAAPTCATRSSAPGTATGRARRAGAPTGACACSRGDRSDDASPH